MAFRSVSNWRISIQALREEGDALSPEKGRNPL